jgi:hypothetical protein
MALNTFSNPIWTLWPEGLMMASAIIFLSRTKTWASDVPVSPARVRLLSFIGLLVTGSTVLLGSVPSYYAIVAIPMIPAPFAFGILVFRPQLIRQWRKLRLYLTICVVISGLTWAVQSMWLFTR